MKFWIDLENLPDVLFFEPIIDRLQGEGHTVVATARKYSSVPDVAELYGIKADVIGRHGGERTLNKLLISGARSVQLGLWPDRRGVDLAIGFGSRPLALTAGVLGVPNVTVYDYEHIHSGAFNRFCDWIMVPEEIPSSSLEERGVPPSKVLRYRGLKEEVYTSVTTIDPTVRGRLGIASDDVLVTVRPPATLAHYHDHTSVEVCQRTLDRIVSTPAVQCVLMTRADDPTFDRYLEKPNVHALTTPIRGLDLIAASDLVVSGGGTMVREAVALGVPSYSTFTGKQGAVDKTLSDEGRLVLVRHPDEVKRIQFAKRTETSSHDRSKEAVLESFVQSFISLARHSGRRRSAWPLPSGRN